MGLEELSKVSVIVMLSRLSQVRLVTENCLTESWHYKLEVWGFREMEEGCLMTVDIELHYWM